MPYTRILVGTDGSDTAAVAVETAAQIAARTRAELVVASVYAEMTPEELASLEDAAPEGEEWQVSASAQADEIVVEARRTAARAGAESTGRSVMGDKPGPSLVDLAAEIDADLIVTGNVGMTGAKRFLLGSVPDYIAHHADCDVLIDHTKD